MSKQKDLKRLSRGELIEIIYLLRKNEQDLKNRLDALQAELDDRRLRIADAGSIAEASLSITQIFAQAQATADIYLNEIEQRRREAEATCQQMIADARKQAEQILSATSHSDT